MQTSSIAEQLLFTTVRIETISSDETTGVGTGFIFSLQRDSSTDLFLVTNKHVIAGASIGTLFFTVEHNGQPVLGDRYTLQVPDFEQKVDWTSRSRDRYSCSPVHTYSELSYSAKYSNLL